MSRSREKKDTSISSSSLLSSSSSTSVSLSESRQIQGYIIIQLQSGEQNQDEQTTFLFHKPKLNGINQETLTDYLRRSNNIIINAVSRVPAVENHGSGVRMRFKPGYKV